MVVLKTLGLAWLAKAAVHHCFPSNDNKCRVCYSIGNLHMGVLDYRLVSIVHKSHMIVFAFLLASAEALASHPSSGMILNAS